MNDGDDVGAPAAAQNSARVAVLLPLPLQCPYDYRVPHGLSVAAGDFVEASLGGQSVVGVVWGKARNGFDEAKLKPLRRRMPAPPMPSVLRRFVDWVAGYTVSPPGAVLKMVMSVPEALLPVAAKAPQMLHLADPQPGIRRTPLRDRVLAILGEGPPRTSQDLAREAGCGLGVIRTLIEHAVLTPIPCAETRAVPDWRHPGVALTADQDAAAVRLRSSVGNGYSVTLLDGVPGAGKTEVYFEAIAAALAQGHQVLVLLPEIALSAQWRIRFRRRFGCMPEEWHSDLPRAHRRRTWRAVAEGTVPVLVGARSALFLPFPNLGLIIVDEEHDASFKQEDGVTYHARDMAIVRARLGDIPCILASATPSLETVVNVRANRYAAIRLLARAQGPQPATVDIIDLRKDPPPRGGFVAPPLRRALSETLDAGQQALLFLNRRGYAPLTLCRACGHRMRCPACTAWLVEHRLLGRLQCHHCGYSTRLPEGCPACGATDRLSACGPGVERLAEEAAGFLPGARCVLATSDTVSGPLAAADLVDRIERRDVDLIIGTQLVAKGYHFPALTLVGIIDADLGLSGGDLRAAERCFQLLYQVSGRAGREIPGRVLVQSCWPEHPVIAALAAAERDRFLAAEDAERRAAAMPPYGRLAALIVSGRDEVTVEQLAAALARAAPHVGIGANGGVRVLGPAPPPLALLRGRHRRRLLVIAPRPFPLSSWIRSWLGAVPPSRSVRVQVDIDPQSFL